MEKYGDPPYPGWVLYNDRYPPTPNQDNKSLPNSAKPKDGNDAHEKKVKPVRASENAELIAMMEEEIEENHFRPN